MKINKKQLDGKIRKPSMILLAFLFLAALYGLYYLYQKPASIVKESPTYAYQQQGEMGFMAAIRPNTVFKETVITEPNKTIYRELLQSFTTTFDYRFKGDQPAELKGSYDVIATVEAKDMWKLDYILVPSTPFSGQGKEVSFHNERVVDLSYFEQVVEQINEEIGAKAREPSLVIKTNINLTADINGQLVTENLAPTMIIPLTTSTFKVGEGEPTIKTEGVLTKQEKVPNPARSNFIYVLMLAVVLGVSLIYMLLLTANTSSAQDHRKQVQEFWRVFWRKYGAHIIKVNQEPHPTELIVVNTMEDLVKVAEGLGKPIIHREVFGVSEPAACYVLDGPRAYKYVIDMSKIPGGRRKINLTGKPRENIGLS